MRVYLIGYRGSGKTTVGRLLAEQLSWAFVDTDSEIAKEEFRKRETTAIENTIPLVDTVISLGGGACQRSVNRELINQIGGVAVWLTGDAETLWQRISGQSISEEQRPSLTELEGLEEVKQLLDRRHENYAACADYEIDTRELPPDQIAAKIANWMQSADKN